VVDFLKIYNVCARKAIIDAAKKIINSDKVCRSYSDLNFGVTFFGTQCSTTFIAFTTQQLAELSNGHLVKNEASLHCLHSVLLGSTCTQSY